MRKVFVLGIDALAPTLVQRWADAGHLPNFSRVMAEGAWGNLRSTGEFSSPQAWPSFLTGVNPGKHGIFSFVQHVPGTYGVERVTSRNLQAPTMFELLSHAGARVASLNVPCTYPVAPLNGVALADWLCPSLDSPGATWPPELAGELRHEVGEYPFHVDLKRHARAGRYGRALQGCLTGLRVKQRVARRLWERGPWDLFALVLVETDAVQHYFWHFSDPRHPLYASADRDRWGEPILEVYREVDRILGEWLEVLDDDTLLLIMSDHGGAIYNRGQVFMPALLRHLGLLVEKRRSWSALRPWRRGVVNLGESLHGRLPKRWKMRLYHHPLTARLVERFFAESLTANNDWARTRAYCYYWETAPWVNLAGREPEGIVQPGEDCEQVRQTLLEALYGLYDQASGEPAVERAFRREEVYHGPCLEYMPDVGVHWNRRIPCSGPLRVTDPPGVIREQAMDVAGLTGGHDPEGTLLARGPGVPAGQQVQGARIEDLAPTILAALGQPLPADLDGRPLPALGVASTCRAAPLPIPGRDSGANPYTEAEAELVGDRLRNLGYL